MTTPTTPDTSALLVIDVLSGVFQLPEPLHDGDGFIAVVKALLSRARDSRTPVVYLQHTGAWGTPFAEGSPASAIDERVNPGPEDLVVKKAHPDAFQDTCLDELLGRLRARTLIVCGFSTEGCIDSTVRSAYSRGYRVVLVADGHTTTRNPILTAGQIVAHHNLVLGRFADVVAHAEVSFQP